MTITFDKSYVKICETLSHLNHINKSYHDQSKEHANYMVNHVASLMQVYNQSQAK